MAIQQKFKEFTNTVYTEQGKCFLNAFWDEHQNLAEEVWGWAVQFAELDIDNAKEGKDLDEFNAHRFLERNNETKTVKQLREEIKEMDMDFNKRLALIEYLLFRTRHSVQEFVSRPQGDNKQEIDAAQAALNQATAAMQRATKALEESTIAAAKAKKEADIAKRSADDAKRAADEATRASEEARQKANIASERAAQAQASAKEARNKRDELQAAEDELKAVLNEIRQQEAARDDKTRELTAKSEDASLGVVQRNKAKNELAQHLSEDPLPLRQAKITQEAATKKAERARLAADASHQAAEQARVEAERAQTEAKKAADSADRAKVEADRVKAAAIRDAEEAERSRRDAERAANEAKRQFEEMEENFAAAQRYLDEVRSRPGNFQGSLWWIDRDLQEARKFMPKSGITKRNF